MSLFQKFGVTAVAILDFETTGLSPQNDFPTEVAIYKVGVSKFTALPFEARYETKLKLPEGVEVPEFITNLTGLTTEDLNTNGIDLAEAIPEVQRLIDQDTLVIAHNANFDLGFLFHHFGIEPAHFMCTRAISILTEPDKNASLKNVFARMFGEKEQTHRAGDDIEMTLDVFNQFVGELGNDSMMFFKNRIVNMPDREISFKPYNAKVLDFTEKYVSKREYENVKEYADKYSRLEAYGIDNWSGYGEAMSDSEGIFEEE
jgi:DNA polymerase III subunit epsilon